MAHTVDSRVLVGNNTGPGLREEITLSVLQANELEAISVQAENQLVPDRLDFRLTTRPTDGSLLQWVWESSSASAETVSVRFMCQAGGSLTGAVGVLTCYYDKAARQDGESIDSDNDD